MPITVEPSKPCMCHDERFLNLWIKDCPFRLDYVTDLPRYVFQGHFQATLGMVMCAYILLALRFSVFRGLAGILCTPRYLSAGRPARMFTITLAWQPLVSFVRMAFHDRSI